MFLFLVKILISQELLRDRQQLNSMHIKINTSQLSNVKLVAPNVHWIWVLQDNNFIIYFMSDSLNDSTWLPPPCLCCSSLIRSYGKKDCHSRIQIKGCHSKYHYLCVPPGTAECMKNHHRLESHTTSGARCIMSVQYMNELATNTKRTYGMKIWEVEHGLSTSLVVSPPPPPPYFRRSW